MTKSGKLFMIVSMTGVLLLAMHVTAEEAVDPQSHEAIKRMADELEAARKAREAGREVKQAEVPEQAPQQQPAKSTTVTKEELETLKQQCEAAREKHLAPLKKAAIDECIANKVKKPAECETFYKDFGEGGITESGAFRQRRFHNIPECRPYYEAEEKFHKNIK